MEKKFVGNQYWINKQELELILLIFQFLSTAFSDDLFLSNECFHENISIQVS